MCIIHSRISYQNTREKIRSPWIGGDDSEKILSLEWVDKGGHPKPCSDDIFYGQNPNTSAVNGCLVEKWISTKISVSANKKH